MPNSGGKSGGRLVLDTSAYAHFRAGDRAVLDLMAAADQVLIPVTVLGELEAGFALGTRAVENRTALSRFLSEPFVSVLDATADVARRYGQVFVKLREAGTPIPTNDIWIAAATLDAGARLLTFDTHFPKVAGLDVILLPAS